MDTGWLYSCPSNLPLCFSWSELRLYLASKLIVIRKACHSLEPLASSIQLVCRMCRGREFQSGTSPSSMVLHCAPCCLFYCQHGTSCTFRYTSFSFLLGHRFSSAVHCLKSQMTVHPDLHLFPFATKLLQCNHPVVNAYLSGPQCVALRCRVLTNTLTVIHNTVGQDRSGEKRATPQSCVAVCSPLSGWFSQPERVSC